MAIVIENGQERMVNMEELKKLAMKHVPKKEWNNFINEVAFRIDAFDTYDLDTNGKSVEEYYFAACLAYAKKYSYEVLYEEMDDCEIFDFCGQELE